MVEHSPEKGGVVGSSPTGATKYAALAERLTRLPAKQITLVRVQYAAPYVRLAELAYAGVSRTPSLLGSNPRMYTKIRTIGGTVDPAGLEPAELRLMSVRI